MMAPVSEATTKRRLAITPARLAMALVLAAFALRFVLAWYSIGTNDAVNWRKQAESIQQHGLFDAYVRYRLLNHPPLSPLWWTAALRIAHASGASFEFVIKLPAILADAGSCALLGWIWFRRRDSRAGWIAAAIFALSPLAILVSAYHCNTDSIYAFLCLLATFLVTRGKMLLAGLALTGAINVKLIPALLILPLLSLCRNRRDVMRFICGLAIGVLPFIPVLIAVGPDFSRKVFGYDPPANRWGIPFALYELYQRPETRRFALDAMRRYVENARVLIFAAIALLSLFSFTRRRWSGLEVSALAFSIFLILTPGFGLQYAVIVLPLMLACSLAWGTVYSLVAGVFLLWAYWSNWTGTVPMFSFFTDVYPLPGAIVGIAAWLLIVAFTLRTLRLAPRPSPLQTSSNHAG